MVGVKIDMNKNRQSRSDKQEASSNTLPETNIPPPNWWLENEIAFWDGLFSEAHYVSGSVSCIHLNIYMYMYIL